MLAKKINKPLHRRVEGRAKPVGLTQEAQCNPNKNRAPPTVRCEWRNVLLRRKPGRPKYGFPDATHRRPAGGDGLMLKWRIRFPSLRWCSCPNTCMLPGVCNPGGCGLSDALVVTQSERFAATEKGRTPTTETHGKARAGDLAAAIVGAPNPGCGRPRSARRLHTLQSGEAWLGEASGRLGAFHSCTHIPHTEFRLLDFP